MERVGDYNSAVVAEEQYYNRRAAATEPGILAPRIFFSHSPHTRSPTPPCCYYYPAAAPLAAPWLPCRYVIQPGATAAHLTPLSTFPIYNPIKSFHGKLHPP
ncbi:hypothetical protein M758_10G068000 [Ceratodon purpureus]|nr:hypothetical protein M758_10G068000 [Ceratodon purpureus]